MGCSSEKVLFTLAIICAWGAFGLGTSAVGAKTWLWTSTKFEGLWVECTNTNNCVVKTATAELNAVRAMVIIGIVFGFIGTIAYSSSFWNRKAISVSKAGFGFIYLGALFWTIAMIVYTAYNSNSVAWGYSYAFGWGCMGLLNLAGGFAHASVQIHEQTIGVA